MDAEETVAERRRQMTEKQIAVVQVMQHGSLDAANQGFLDGLKERGYGADKISVDQQNAQETSQI